MKEKKKFLLIPIAIIIVIVLVAVIFLVLKMKKNGETNAGQSKEESLKVSKYVDLNGIYVDSSDKKKHPDEALIYVLYTVKSDDKNISFYTYMANNPGTALTIKINDTNEYEDTIYASVDDDFRYTGYENLNDGQSVLSGTSLKCIGAFRVSQNDLKEGGIIELTLKGTNNFQEVFEYKTDDVKYFENAKEILKNADNETYEKVEKENKEKLAKISSKTEKKIKKVLQENYYYWYNSTIATQIEFNGNKFKVSNALGSNSGTYEIRKKVILLHYKNGGTNQFAYEFKNGEVSFIGIPE